MENTPGGNPPNPKKETVKINLDFMLPEKLRGWIKETGGTQKFERGTIDFSDKTGKAVKRFWLEERKTGGYLLGYFGETVNDFTGYDILDGEGNLIEKLDKDGNEIRETGGEISESAKSAPVLETKKEKGEAKKAEEIRELAKNIEAKKAQLGKVRGERMALLMELTRLDLAEEAAKTAQKKTEGEGKFKIKY